MPISRDIKLPNIKQPTRMFPRHQNPSQAHRRLSTTSTCSAWSSDDNIILVTAVPSHPNPTDQDDYTNRHSAMATATSQQQHPHHQHHHRQDNRGSSPNSRRQSSTCASERSCEGLTAEHMRDLWRCMLELQERYGCYHSTRIDLAMEAGDDGVSFMPNRFIIDTLNESVIDLLPEEGWEMLERHLHHNQSSGKKSSSRIWRALDQGAKTRLVVLG